MESWLMRALRRLPPGLAGEDSAFPGEKPFVSLAGARGDGGAERWSELEAELKEGLAIGKGATQHKGRNGVSEEAGQYLPLRERLAEAYSSFRGEETDPQNVLLTDSVEGALDLLLRTLVRDGGTVLVESPASPEALELMRQRGISAVPVACDRDGMLPDELQRLAGLHKPALAYVTPQFSNPSGRRWSRQRKLALLEVCGRLAVPVVEDAAAVPFAASPAAGPGEPEAPASLYRLRRQAGTKAELAEVIAIGSLEATLAPTLPLAWLRGEEKRMKRLLRQQTESASPLGLPAPGQVRLLHAWLGQPPASWQAHAAAVTAEYAARRALLLQLLRQPVWQGADAADPGGGLYLWVRLPPGIGSEALLRASLLKGTAFLPGPLCCAGEPDDGFIRLTFAAQREALLREGMARISEAMGEFTARRGE